MNDIQIFDNPDFGEIRTVIIDGNPWFVGRDIALKLGYSKPQNALKDNVDEGDARKHGIPDSNNHIQQMVVINEAGLYSLIFGSKLESAKKFKRWVTSEVLPSIRKSGNYNLPESADGKIALLAQGHMELRQEIDSVKADVENIKNDMPVLPVEAETIEKAIKKVGMQILGGKGAPAYKDRTVRQKLYIDLHVTLRRNFDCKTYKSIRRKDVDKAIEVIESYKPPLFLEEQIAYINRGGDVL